MKTIPLMMALALGGAGSHISRAAPAAETPAQRAGCQAISAAYTQIDKALASGNFAAAASYFAPDFSERILNGQVRNRAQSLAALRQPSGVPFAISDARRNISLTLHGKDILATNQLTLVGKAGMGARAVPPQVVSQWRDLWTPTPRGWKIHQRVKIGAKAWADSERVRVASLHTPRAAQSVETPAQRAGNAAITAAYEKIDGAMMSGDFTAKISYLAPNYSVRSMDGKVRNRAQSEAALRQGLGPLRLSKITRRRPPLTWRGKDAVVTNHLTAVGKVTAGARTVPIKVISQSRDIWTPTPRGWKIRQSLTTGTKMWVNGKRVR